jgi:hypothetical protein
MATLVVPYPVTLELTHGTAEWLAEMLTMLAEEDESEREGLLDMADALMGIVNGTWATVHPEHYKTHGQPR